MKRLSNECVHHRQQICLLASGALPEAERVEVENHLSNCTDCRVYYDGIKSVASPLADWEKHFASIEPSQAQQIRWAKAIKEASEVKPKRSVSPVFVLQVLWSELIWPVRRVWAGLAIAWVFIVIVNHNLSEGRPVAMAKDARPAADMFLAWREQELVLAELVGKAEPTIAEPPKQSMPQPRSERSQTWATV